MQPRFVLFLNQIAPIIWTLAGFKQTRRRCASQRFRQSPPPEIAIENNHAAALLRGADGGAKRHCCRSVMGPGRHKRDGFVAPDGSKGKHYADQLDLYKSFGCKQEWLTPQDVTSHVEATKTLTF